jgi:glycerol uptake facilitator protein
MLAELVGTTFLVLIGPGSAATATMLTVHNQHAISLADIGFIGLAFGSAITIVIYSLGHISGAHINPAVTFSLASVGLFPWSEVPKYIGAQLLGSVFGALGIILILGQEGVTIGNVGATVLGSSVGYLQGLGIEVMLTIILVLVIMGVAIDPRSPKSMTGLAIGLAVFVDIMIGAASTGASMNPARSFGPYVVLSIFGNIHEYWNQFPIYVFGPLIGGVVAAFLYNFIARYGPFKNQPRFGCCGDLPQ